MKFDTHEFDAVDHTGFEQSVSVVLADMLRLHRDWRIDAESPEKSVVFMMSGSVESCSQLAPVSGESKAGRILLPVFFALSQAIESYRRISMIKSGNLDLALEPRSFAIVVHGVRCRVQLVKENRYHVRVPSSLLEMEKMGMPESLRHKLTSSDLDSGGLVVVCGSYGSGKTSTVNAVVKERIRHRGGYALVIGNPIEYEYSGFHGSTERPGYIEQIDLVGLDLGSEIKSSMRNFPSGAVSILAYPELIGSSGVGEMLRAANRGNLVFADMHALNMEASIINLISMAENDDEGYARELLGNSLRLVIHQKMTTAAKAFNSGKSVHVSYTHIVINRSMRAAIVDKSIPISRAITNVLAVEN